MDDPLAGLEELISSTMAVVDAPSAPGNSLETQGNKVAAAKDDPNGVAIPALDSLAELASIDLGPLDAATPVATPAKEVLLNSTPSVLVSQSGSPGDIDLIGSLTQISVPVTMVNMHGPTSPQGGGLGPAFSVDLHEDVPLQRSVLSSSQPAHVQPLASFSDPLAPALSSTHTNDYDPFSGRSGISANASTLAPPQRSIGSTTVGTHEPLAAFPSHTSSYSSQDTHGLGHVRSGVGAGSSSAGYGQLQPEASGSVSGNAQRVSIGGRSAAAPDEEHPVKVTWGVLL